MDVKMYVQQKLPGHQGGLQTSRHPPPLDIALPCLSWGLDSLAINTAPSFCCLQATQAEGNASSDEPWAGEVMAVTVDLRPRPGFYAARPNLDQLTIK